MYQIRLTHLIKRINKVYTVCVKHMLFHVLLFLFTLFTLLKQIISTQVSSFVEFWYFNIRNFYI